MAALPVRLPVAGFRGIVPQRFSAFVPIPELRSWTCAGTSRPPFLPAWPPFQHRVRTDDFPRTGRRVGQMQRCDPSGDPGAETGVGERLCFAPLPFVPPDPLVAPSLRDRHESAKPPQQEAAESSTGCREARVHSLTSAEISCISRRRVESSRVRSWTLGQPLNSGKNQMIARESACEDSAQSPMPPRINCATLM